MKNELAIKKALNEISQDATRSHAEAWQQISSKLEIGGSKPGRTVFSKRRVFVLVCIAMLTIAASVYYLLMDAGLKKADEAGLVAHLNQTAQPTVFAALPGDLAAAGIESQTQNGITVTLNWAYADKLRVAWQLTISGLVLPQGANLEDYVCTPYVTSLEGIALKPVISQQKVLSDQPGNPIAVTYISYQAIDTDKLKQLTLDLQLTIGPCGNSMFSDDWTLGTKPIPTAVPLIGTYHLNFQIPINQGNTLQVNQIVEAGGVKMTLKSITTSPSYTIADFCYPKIEATDLNGNARADWFWWLQGTTLQFDDEEPVRYSSNNYISLPDQGAEGESQQCQSLGFIATSSEQAKKITLSVATMQTSEFTEDYLSLLTQKNALAKLTEQGIKIEVGYNGKSYWKILQKPANMSEDQANQIVEELLWHTISGPWTFTIDTGA